MIRGVLCSFILVLASAQDAFLASSASAARRLDGSADGSASGGSAGNLVCESCISKCKWAKGVKCKKFCLQKSCVWQKDIAKTNAAENAAGGSGSGSNAEICESCISSCKLKAGKNKCRKTCVNEKSCVWQADIAAAAIAAGNEAAQIAETAECKDDDSYGFACAEKVGVHPAMCDQTVGYVSGCTDISKNCRNGDVKLYEVCKKSCGQCNCKDTETIRCADITSSGTRFCSLTIADINKDFTQGYSGDTSQRIDQVCKKSCDKC